MTQEEIKKQIYKQKPIAHLIYIRKGIAYYNAKLIEMEVSFYIPITDMGDADFCPIMEAKLLNRWIVI